MRVCVITTVHQPNDVRIAKELKTLKNANFDIVYIAPQGEFDIEGIKYKPIKRYTNRVERIIKAPKVAYKIALEVDADVYHFHDPELIDVGLKLKKRGKKVIYDIHEDYSSVILKKKWIPFFLRMPIAKYFKKKEEKVVEQIDGIVVVVEEQLERFENDNFAIIPNYPVLSIFEDLSYDKNNDVIRFVYIGSIDEDRAIYETIEAFRHLSQKEYHIEYNLIGPIYTNRLKTIIQKTTKEISSFKYHGKMSQKKALEIASNCDVGMLVIHRGKSKEESSPLKMFEYMALGLPIIASNFKKWKDFLDNPNCALYVEPESIEDIAEKMEMLVSNAILRKNLSIAGRKKIKEYSWDSVEDKLIELYRKVLN